MKIEIPSFNKIHVLIVGDVMLDTYWRGNTSRVSPEAPVPIVQVNQLEDRAGGAANVALNVASLGAKASLIGFVGSDPAAETLEKILVEHKIDCNFLRSPNIPTINKLRVISHNQQLIRLDFEDGFAKVDSADLLTIYKKKLLDADIVILSDYGKGTLAESRKLISLARKAHVPVFVDPKNVDFSFYEGATLVTPNLTEFQAVVGKCKDNDELAKKAYVLIKQHNLDGLVITKSAEGMSLVTKEGEATHIPTRAREVFDVTGAGDTAIATLAAVYAANKSFTESVVLANAAAGVVVRKLGTSTISIAELRRAMQRQQDPWAAILTEDELLKQIKDAKAHGEKIVMTNGCFDILHSGHVIYLEKAKALGHRLLIAVNDDASVRRLKGNARPINSLEARMLVLSSLRAVDWVVPFSEDTPDRIIKAVTPDILVKGGDYIAHEIVGYDHVTKSGGKVKIIPFEEGFSTTSMVERIKNDKEEK
jgi:D-beta-D-heptose 7-phosphate kinase/D-beta-D-heptose 1-phosphate adenosyltransferase